MDKAGLASLEDRVDDLRSDPPTNPRDTTNVDRKSLKRRKKEIEIVVSHISRKTSEMWGTL
jgi:hypothetical protein